MIKYVSDFDQLSWTINLESHAFYECELDWDKRTEFINWLDVNIIEDVLIWNGLVTPVGSAFEHSKWGSFVTPNGKTFYIIFLNNDDETKFALQYTSSNIFRKKHKNGIAAYHNRRGQ